MQSPGVSCLYALPGTGKGLCVIQQRYNEKTKATYWSAIDPWLTDKIYLHEGFRQYFDSHAKKKTQRASTRL